MLSKSKLVPTPDYPVDLLYQLTVTDAGGLTDSTYLAVNVRHPADRPSFGVTRRVSMKMRPGRTLSRVLPAATGGDGALTYTLTPPVPGVMAFDAATRQVIFTPTAAGTWDFDYQVADSEGSADTITVSLRAAAESTSPRFATGAAIRDLRLSTGRDVGPVTATVPLPPLPAATGGDGDLAYTLEPAVPGLSLDPRTRRITGTPTAAGSYAMTYRVVDSDADTGATDSAALTFTLDVAANTAPVALFAGQTVSRSVKIPGTEWHLPLLTYPYGIDLRGYFYDADGDDLRFTAETLPSGVHISGCTAYRWPHCLIPTSEGTRNLVVTATDPSGATATQKFRLTGLPANRAPVVITPSTVTLGLSRDIRDGRTIGTYGTTLVLRHRVGGYFSDPDGDRLTYRAVTSDPRLHISIHIINNDYSVHGPIGATPSLTVDPVRGHTDAMGNWTATVTVSATDPEGESAYIDVPITVRNASWDGPAPVPPTVGAPSFGDATVADRSWPADKAIVPLTLPAATGGTAPLSYTLTPAVPGLTFDAAARTLSGTPTTAADAAAMTYQVSDSHSPVRTATLSFDITITAADQAGTTPPTSEPIVVILDEDTAHTFAADQFPFADADTDEYLHQLRIDTLPGQGALLLDDVEQAAGATIALADLGALQYRPPADWNGSTSFTFKVVDTTGRASTDAYHAYVTVTPVNDAPASADVERSVAEDTTLTFVSADFAFVDVDGPGDRRSGVLIATLPPAAAGTLTLAGRAVYGGQSIAASAQAISALQFTPAADWNGTASFLFGVMDTSGAISLVSNTATIHVTPVNDAPATADLTRSMDEGTTLELTVADFPFDDVDADDRLTSIVITQAPRSGTPPQPAGTLTSFHGSVETAVDGGDTVAAAGLTRLAYRPDPGFAGEVTFTFQVVDQAGAVSEPASGVVRVAPVNDPPASESFTIAWEEDQVVTLAAADFAFRDPDPGDRLKEVLVLTLPQATQGVLAVDGTPVRAHEAVPRGSLDDLTFTPVADWRGVAQFTFRVVDQAGARSLAAYAANIEVADVNDAPTAQDLVRRWTPTMDFKALFESVFADPDPDDRLKEIRIEETPGGGLLWSPRSDVPQTRGSVIAAVDLRHTRFEPFADTYRGSVVFRVYDQSGEAAVESNLLSLWDNSPPTASALERSTREDTPLPLTPADFDGVFTDAEQPPDRLSEVVIAEPPVRAQGALTLDGVAVGAGQVIARNRLVGLVFTPAADWYGDAEFSFRVRDREGAQSEPAPATVTVTAVADAPEAGVLAVSTPEDTPLAFTAADFERVFRDADPGDSLAAVRVVSGPSLKHGELKLDGAAMKADEVIEHKHLERLSFEPAADWIGLATFDFKLVDESRRESKLATARVAVTSVADAPAAGALNLVTPENTVLEFAAADFEGVFRDADAGDALKAVKVVSLPDAGHGALTLDVDKGADDDDEPKPGDEQTRRDEPGVPGDPPVTADQVIARGDLGTLRFTPEKDWNGDASFMFRLVDRTDTESVAAKATITVKGVHDGPVAEALHVSTAEDTPLTFTAADFDGVFRDPDAGDSLTAVRVVDLPDAGHGELALNGTALSANRKIERADLESLAFTPVADWNGDAVFTFRVVDQSHAESVSAAPATITVTAVADPPVAGPLDRTTPEDEPLTFTAADFEGVFSDADEGDSLKSVRVLSLPDKRHGALALNGTAVTVTVDQVIARGDLGTLAFTPAANFAGEAAFEFQVLDQGDTASATATATITVTEVADAPVAGALHVSTAEDTALTFAASDFAGVFTDADAGDGLTAVRVVSLPHMGHGALTLGGTAVTAGRKIVQADLGTLTFTPVADWNGDASFRFQVADRSDAESAEATVTVTVTAVADPPAAGPLAVSTAEDTVLTFAAADFAEVFRDPDEGDSLKWVKVTSLPDAAHGVLKLDGTEVTADRVIAHGDLGMLTFTPAADWNGAAAFAFTVADQTDAESAAAATATVTVTAVADAPVAGALHVSTAEDTALVFAAADFVGVFSDADAGDSLKSVKVTGLPDAGHGVLELNGSAVTADRVIAQGDLGTLVFTPATDWNGAATFAFKVVDQADVESAAAATATVTVTAVADAPVAGALHVSTAEDTALAFTASEFEGVYTDADGDGLKAVKVTSLPDAGNGVLELSGNAVTAEQVIARADLAGLTFTPAADWNGAAAFGFQVSDAGDLLSGTATATVTVTAVADAPAAGALEVSTAEDTAWRFATSDFDGVFSDADAGDGLKAVKVVSLPDAGHGVLELSGSEVTAEQVIARADLAGLTFTPAANWHGAAAFGFRVSDASDLLSGTATATVTVSAVADAPAAGALNVSTAEDTALAFTASDFEEVFTDADGDSLKAVTVVSLPDAGHGVLKLSGSEVTAEQVIARADLAGLTFTPVADWNGAAAFGFRVSDASDLLSGTATATVTVSAVADAPAAGALR